MVARPTGPRCNDAVAIVTGGSWGAGRALASALARRGYALVVVYLRDQGEAESVVEDVLDARGSALAVRADITDELDVERLFAETEAAFGQAGIVAHAARRGASVLYGQAARRLRPGGAIVSVSSADAITPALAMELRVRGITVNGLAPGLEPPGRDHDVAELVGLLDRWRGSPVG
jgi:3-oxoacyl-[acyl-carrier protein] reductase